jgi:hypothetical protein
MICTECKKEFECNQFEQGCTDSECKCFNCYYTTVKELLATDELPEHVSDHTVYLEEVIDNIMHCEIETGKFLSKAREMFVFNIA